MDDDEKKVFWLSEAYREKWSQLEESFRELNRIDNPSQREYYFKFESERLEIATKEYKHLYEIYNKPEEKLSSWDKAKNWLWKSSGLGGKTFWDYIQLLVIPIVLAFATQQITEQISSDRARQETLNKYFDELASLLKSNLKGTGTIDVSKLPKQKKEEIAKKNSEIRRNAEELQVFARAKTFTALKALDNSRKVLLLLFLKEARLIEAETPVIKLNGADLSGINLDGINLDSINLAGVNLSHANLSRGSFCYTDFRNANLGDAKLQSTRLFQALFDNADLRGSKAQNSVLIKAEFNNTEVEKADFTNAIFSNNVITRTDFGDAYNAKTLNESEERISYSYRKTQLGLPKDKSYTEKSGCPMPVFKGPGFDYRIIGSLILDETVIDTFDAVVSYDDDYEWQRISNDGWIPTNLYDLDD